MAPVPDVNRRTGGKRPHLHKDAERQYIEERVALEPRVHHEKSPTAVVHPDSLPKLAAYPVREFKWEKQNRHGQDSRKSVGFARIITDEAKNQLGVSYHPYGKHDVMERAEAKGAFIADYRRDSLKNENEEKKDALTPSNPRSSTWPKN